MIEESMRLPGSSSALFAVLFITAALIGTPIAIFALQQQQEIRQRADTTVAWATDQSATSSCPAVGTSAIITVSFSNTEPNLNSLSMDVSVVDRQSGKSVSLGSIRGGQTKTGVIQTGKATLASGTVDFNLKWTDGHSGTDSRTASYRSVSNCYPSNPTPTTPKYPSTSPAVPTPSGKPYSTPKPSVVPYPSPTICPTLGPVKNVRIDCPNCPE